MQFSWTTREGIHGTSSGSTVGLTGEGGAVLDKHTVDMNENYINYIQYNPKLVQTVDALAVADMRMTVHYPTLNLPCNNKQLSISPLPIRMPNREIITSTHTSLLPKQYLTMAAWKTHIFPGLNKALLSIGTFFDHG